ncbi:PTS sugar transporter subunit IIA [Gilliamella sp. B2776]|uniref:PTS galactosamine/N-acetylgalactosamine transporter subunit IIA n=1 Tax=unclassified Gilliamella TaxID=2685620 RepID=UPI00226A3C9B|nr:MULTISPECIES: PTS galactosamine/N-acetylgalactosamine transporter subunit IIA [unclassified Gilliamella]MCX8649799.1 PTS sugar transporter subunit IIA [Gilliamella sp. B2779]MCX8653690.1 PTS sugar transporter subunit IIA [Gilliamella sp. B2737]MCX8656119.1 PTS sugar transporter subunit IIA [Gilliamella sp. B2894]MCX8664573.1 PTS sugar transporter subunit IIA [Gilliamella sp. B2887]MCX8691572.1 PTS sugar transporter subunit IIA [Gilliamella sp. B2776]
MLGVILTGHGGFATGLYEAVVQIIGKQAQFTAINFPDGMSTKILEQQLTDALKKCDKGDGVIFFTDILGGTPFQLAARLNYQFNHVEIISGTNLPILLEMLLQRDELDAENFRLRALDIGKSSITSLWSENHRKSIDKKEYSDGI